MKFSTEILNDVIDCNNEVVELVVKTFLKHIKENKLYIPFRIAVNNRNCANDVYHIVLSQPSVRDRYTKSIQKLGRYGSNFYCVNNYIDLCKCTKKFNNSCHTLKIEDSTEFQMAIMDMVNGLIHSCIEYYIETDFKILEKLGEDIFKDVCTKLLGEAFEDKTKQMIDSRHEELMKLIGQVKDNPQYLKTIQDHGVDMSSLLDFYIKNMCSTAGVPASAFSDNTSSVRRYGEPSFGSVYDEFDFDDPFS